jgi:crossover junction endodeoxyribonuclease RuvC
MNFKKIVMGIDPGSQKTGYALLKLQSTKIEFVASGLIEPKTTSLESRLEKIYTSLQEVLSKYKPEAVAVEKIFYAINAKSSLVLAHARGVALLACKLQESNIFEFSPTQIKKSITGSGSASKEQVAKTARLLFKTPPMSLDESDALSAASCLANYISIQKKIKLITSK